MKSFHVENIEETFLVAAALAETLRPGDIVAYKGGLGVGKTTFTRGLAKSLGISQPVSSPTFALVHEYRGGRNTLVHFDMYRISGFEDLESTGFFDYLDGENILAIEWSEKIEEELPAETIKVTLERDALSDGGRTITIEGGAF